jgi:uncharacterized protein YjbI with pentapeptide repeats
MSSILKNDLLELGSDDLIQGKVFCGKFVMPKKGAVYTDCVFDQVSFDNVSMSQLIFQRCKFIGGAFDSAHLIGCVFDVCQFDGVHLFTQCVLEDCLFSSISAGQFDFVRSRLFSNNFNDLIANQLGFMDSYLGMNVHSGCEYASLSYVRVHLVDEGISDVKMSLLVCEESNINRQIFGGATIGVLSVKNTRGEMIRYFKSHFEKLNLFSCDVSQYAVSQCDIEVMSLTACHMILPDFSSTKISKFELINCELDRPLFDAAKMDRCDMSLVNLRGGSLRGINIKDWLIRRSSFDSIDARDCCVQSTDIQGLVVANSNFRRQKRDAWHGASFSNTEFEDQMSIEEKHWWGEFRRGADTMVS